MASRTLRRRLHHGDVGEKRRETHYDSLNEPLLHNYHSLEDTLEEPLDDKQRKERLHWTLLFSNLIVQWAQLLANIVFGAGSLIGRCILFMSSGNGATGRLVPPLLSPLQEARLKYLKERLAIPFDGTTVEHQDALKQLWRLAYPDRQIPPLKSELWKEMGWQGTDPSTDFRGGGFISLENLIYFAEAYPKYPSIRSNAAANNSSNTASKTVQGSSNAVELVQDNRPSSSKLQQQQFHLSTGDHLTLKPMPLKQRSS